MVVYGGNVAIDCARNAHRLGAADDKMFCLESRDTMPASNEEILEAEEENVGINPLGEIRRSFVNDKGEVTGIIFKKCLPLIGPEIWQILSRI